MKIVVSACLLGENCKYSDGNNRNERLLALPCGHEVIHVCQGGLGGLPVPRIPAEIVDGVVKNRDGISVDPEFRRGAAAALDICIREKPDLVILQPRSPSCGVGTVYDGTFSGKLVPGNGVFAAMASENGFRVANAEQILEKERLEP